MEARAPRIAMGVMIVLGAGCSAILGLEDNLQYTPNPPPTDGGGGDAGPDAPAGVTCADGGGICLSKNPSYSGPLLVYTGPEKPGCPGQTPPSFAGEALLDVPDADCGCACASTCPPAIDAVFFTDSLCTNPCGTATVDQSTCAAVNCVTDAGVFATFDAGVACKPTSYEIPEAGIENVVACQANSLAGDCPAGLTCYPNPPAPFGPYCVSLSQITTCPSDYPYAVVKAYEGFVDRRTCACTCTPPPPGDCAITLDDSVACAAAAATITAGACTPLPGGADAGLEIVDASDPGPCTPGGGLIGSVIAQGAETLFCCAQ